MKPLPNKSDIFSRHQVSSICSPARTKHIFQTLSANLDCVPLADIGAAQRAYAFAIEWKSGKMFSFDEPALNCNRVIDLSERHKNLLSA